MQTLRNKVQLIGHLGSDPDFKTTENGKNLARFSVATNDYYRNQEGEKIQETQWHNIVTFGKTAEIAGKYLKKGKEIALEGKINTRSYEDNGTKKYFTEIIADEIVMLGAKV